MDYLLLEVAKLRWYIRYPAAACTLYASWWMLKESEYAIPSILFICAMIMIKEISPSLMLLAGSIWLWPSGFFNIPFAQMTFGILCQFLLSVVFFVLSPIAGLMMYIKRQHAKYVIEIGEKDPIINIASADKS
jgi:hypothetical protein